MNDLNNYLNNVSLRNYSNIIYFYLQKDEYYTHVFYQKSYVEGHEIIKGAFYAVNKNKTPEPKNIDTSFYYMNNNKPQYYINNNKNNSYNNNYFLNDVNNCWKSNNTYNNGNNTNFELIAKVFFILFCCLIVFLIYDFVSLYKNVKKDNNIERNRCIEEYRTNKCEKMTSSEGPIINDFCTEKLKCIHDHTVYFYVVLIKYIRSIIYNCIRGNSLINISLFAITITIIIKILY